MNTNSKRLSYYRATVGALLACLCCVYQYDSRPGALSLGREYLQEGIPTYVGYRSAQPAVLEHVFHAQALRSDEAVAINKLSCDLMVVVAACIPHLFVKPLELGNNLASPLTSAFRTRELFVDTTKFAKAISKRMRRAEYLAVARCNKALDPNVDPNDRAIMDWNVGINLAQENRVPLPGVAHKTTTLGLSFERAMQVYSDITDVLQTQFAVDQLATTTVVSHVEGKAVESVTRFKPRISTTLATFQSREESAERHVKPFKRVGHGVAIKALVVGIRSLQHRKALRLKKESNRLTGHLIHKLPVIERLIVQAAMRLKSDFHLASLIRVRIQPVFERLPEHLCESFQMSIIHESVVQMEASDAADT